MFGEVNFLGHIINKDGLKPQTSKVKLFVQFTTPFFYKQSIFDPHSENCLGFSKKSPQKIV